MGRKGIGKLSLFSIARIVEVHSGKNGRKNGFRMVLEDIKKKIEEKETGTYYPISIKQSEIKISNGTRIILSDLKKNISQTSGALRKRLSRRFGIIGAEYDFSIELDGIPVTVTDR